MSSTPTSCENRFNNPPRGGSADVAPSGSIPLSAIQNLIRRLREEPFDVELHLKLAQAYLAEMRFEDAVSTMKKAMALPTADVKVEERFEDVTILRTRNRLAVALREAQTDHQEELADLVHKLRLDLNRLELDVFQRRSERYPGDTDLRFGLATRLRRSHKLDEAVANLEPLLNDGKYGAVAQLEMGICRQQQAAYVVALSHYRRAAAASGDEHREVKKRALYRAGALALKLKLTDSARQYWGDLVKLDPNYKDAASQLEKLRTGS